MLLVAIYNYTSDARTLEHQNNIHNLINLFCVPAFIRLVLTTVWRTDDNRDVSGQRVSTHRIYQRM
jgi:hypothetical protein